MRCLDSPTICAALFSVSVKQRNNVSISVNISVKQTINVSVSVNISEKTNKKVNVIIKQTNISVSMSNKQTKSVSVSNKQTKSVSNKETISV